MCIRDRFEGVDLQVALVPPLAAAPESPAMPLEAPNEPMIAGAAVAAPVAPAPGPFVAGIARKATPTASDREAKAAPKPEIQPKSAARPKAAPSKAKTERNPPAQSDSRANTTPPE